MVGLVLVAVVVSMAPAFGQDEEGGPFWNATDRGAKVAALIPGRRVPKYTPDTLFADWTTQQVERWAATGEPLAPDAAYAQHAAADPTDAELTADFPVHISPFGRVLSGDPGNDKADGVLVSYCPVCDSQGMSLQFDPDDPYGHAVMSCCGTDLYADPADYAADSPLPPNAAASFPHLDDTLHDIPCTRYLDARGVEWELFIGTLFDHERWLKQGCDLVRTFGNKFRETADPLYVHKIAIILDQVADTYYALPLAANHKVCGGKDGGPLTRAEWEAVPRPAIFEVSYLGAWSKRKPYSSPGWLNMVDEHIWVEPFARVRHHPTFKQVSQELYGDPEALDLKIREKLLRELSLMFKSVFSQKLLHNYQEAIYVDLWLLGLLLEDDVLIDFTAPTMALSMYNHSYQDGMNGEGAPNYMDMPGGYYYPYMRDPDGWLEYYPDFLDDNPFHVAAAGEMNKVGTVRGLELEFGDQHEKCFAPNFITDPAQVAAREKTGSRNWAGYGMGLIRVGGPGHRQEIGLSYTRATLHNSQDALSLECWVDGVPVMRRGGYGAWWSNAHLQWDRPEFQALKDMGYPTELAEGEWAFDAWSWIWVHSPMCQNGVMVDEMATGRGWADNRGYGECITFKGGEEAGSPGSSFQVLDARDHYSWAQVDKDVSDFRRTVIGVEGPDGRPYAVDLLKLAGGKRHALYNSAWGERADDGLPSADGTAATLSEVFFGDELPEGDSHYRNFAHARNVERLGDVRSAWDLTWKTDYAAFAPRETDGTPFKRPLPDDVGQVRLRMLGLDQADGQTELMRATGPWVGWMRQPLPGNQQVNGNVAFMDARDFLIETRSADTGDLTSLFVHVLEGFREGEQSAIESTTLLEAVSTAGPARDIVALELRMVPGHVDTVIFQSDAGTIRLPDGTETDARYALIRRDADGEVIAADASRGTALKRGDFRADMPGDFTGTIVDVVGDLTGTRSESALIIKPDTPWPAGANLSDKQLLIRVESESRDACNEGYRIASVTQRDDGLVRVDLQDHAPLATSWHEVVELPADRPNVIRTWRPMADHANTPWYRGMKLWFPERGKTYTIASVNELGGGFGGDTVELVGDVDLAADGIQLGDWYLIHAVEPGLTVTVANDFSFRQEPASEWKQHSVRATGDIRLASAATALAHHCQSDEGAWESHPGGRDAIPSSELGAAGVSLISGKPDWLELDDAAAPNVARVSLDGEGLETTEAIELGAVDPPTTLVVEFADDANPIDPDALDATLDGKPLGEFADAALSGDGKTLTVTVDLAGATAGDLKQSRLRRVALSASDRSVARHRVSMELSYTNRVPLDPDAVYLSDLEPLNPFAHGGLLLDRDYAGKGVSSRGHVYQKSVMICPEPTVDDVHGEVTFELPAGRDDLVLVAEIAIEDMAKTYGSVVFMVQRSDSADGPWETLYTSPTVRGGGDPIPISVELGAARFVRLFTTDGGDGINSDHAVWGDVRLK